MEEVGDADFTDPIYDDPIVAEIFAIAPDLTAYERSTVSRGPLSVERLPSDAWEKWCKEGAICFSMEDELLTKVYFVNPRDLMVYHVTDFVYRDFNLGSVFYNVGCILIGSKIYILGGCLRYGAGYSKEVYFCDVAEFPSADGVYKWTRGPSLNFEKACPMVFSLLGNIYMLSLDCTVGEPFEVLKANKRCWEVLPQPPAPLWSGWDCRAMVRGSYVVGDSKIVVDAKDLRSMLFIYDVINNTWNKVELPGNDLLSNLPKHVHDYRLNVVDTCFFFDKNWNFHFLPIGAIDPSFSFSHPTAFDGQNLVEASTELESWQLIQLTDTKFCLIAFYNDYNPHQCRLRLCTFDFVVKIEAGQLNDRRLMAAQYSVQNVQHKSHVLWDRFHLLPHRACSKIGAFSVL